MERESTLHGPREDDDLAKNVEGLVRGSPVEPRARDDRRLEDPDEHANSPDERPFAAHPGPIDEREATERAELARLMTGLHFPASRREILSHAADNGAEEPQLAELARLPEGNYEVFEAIWEALGGPPDAG
jgi:hypothetical protein